MKTFLTVLLCTFVSFIYGQTITEVMYNPPEAGIDSLEFIEIYNNTDADVDLTGYSTIAVDYTFEDFILGVGEYVVLVKDSSAYTSFFPGPVIEWTGGSLNNTGEEVGLVSPDSTFMISFIYANGGVWPELANAGGSSIELCNPNDAVVSAFNWGPSAEDTGIVINETDLRCTPGRANNPICGQGGVEYTDLVINEILYDDPSTVDSLEYIEIYNFGDDTVSMAGWRIEGDINHELPGLSILPKGHLVISKNDEAISRLFAVPSFQWLNMENLGDATGTIKLISDQETVIDSVVYENGGSWPEATPGQAITLCNIAGDNSDGANWTIAENTVEDPDLGTINGSPWENNTCGSFTIGELTETDENGTLLMLGETVTTVGVVYGNNIRGGGLQFTIIDEENNGIAVFNLDQDLGYQVRETDEVRVTGTLEQFNGLAQINATSIQFNSFGNLQFDPTKITELNEDTESQLVFFENAYIVDTEQWTNDGSGFNVDITNGVDTLVMRIDNDVDIYELAYPIDTFNVIGIGGQFDNSEPYLDGYQFLPRYMTDINPYTEFMDSTIVEVDGYPVRTISEMTTEAANGAADSLGVACTLQGIVYGINLSTNDLIFTLIDGDNNGIGVFSDDNTIGYDVVEGDMLEIKGTIGQFSGLTQIAPDSLTILSSGNDLLLPTSVSSLGEETESSFIVTEFVDWVNPNDWVGDGSSFNINVTDGTNEYTIRIDNETEMASGGLPVAAGFGFLVQGIGGQFDNSDPFDSGYQIFPRYYSDFIIGDATFDLTLDSQISFQPNPVTEVINIVTELQLDNYVIHNLSGQILDRGSYTANIQVDNLPPGMYVLKLFKDDKFSTKKFIKQ